MNGQPDEGCAVRVDLKDLLAAKAQRIADPPRWIRPIIFAVRSSRKEDGQVREEESGGYSPERKEQIKESDCAVSADAGLKAQKAMMNRCCQHCGGGR